MENLLSDHECMDYLDYRQAYWSENMDPDVDGAIECWWEEWWQCTVCGEKFTTFELEAIAKRFKP